MKQLKSTITLILIVASVLMARPNFQGGNRGTCEMGIGRHNPMSELGLTEDQQKKMDEMHLKFQKSAIDQHAAIQKKSIDKRQAMQNDDFIVAKKLTNELFDLKKEMAVQKISQHEEMLKILTPEQKTKLKTLHREGHGKMGKRGMRMHQKSMDKMIEK